MHDAVKLFGGLLLLVPGVLLLLRGAGLAPSGLEAITTFFVGGVRLGLAVPALMSLVGAVLVMSSFAPKPPTR